MNKQGYLPLLQSRLKWCEIEIAFFSVLSPLSLLNEVSMLAFD